jgi:hypothetical protein
VFPPVLLRRQPARLRQRFHMFPELRCVVRGHRGLDDLAAFERKRLRD